MEQNSATAIQLPSDSWVSDGIFPTATILAILLPVAVFLVCFAIAIWIFVKQRYLARERKGNYRTSKLAQGEY